MLNSCDCYFVLALGNICNYTQTQAHNNATKTFFALSVKMKPRQRLTLPGNRNWTTLCSWSWVTPLTRLCVIWKSWRWVQVICILDHYEYKNRAELKVLSCVHLNLNIIQCTGTNSTSSTSGITFSYLRLSNWGSVSFCNMGCISHRFSKSNFLCIWFWKESGATIAWVGKLFVSGNFSRPGRQPTNIFQNWDKYILIFREIFCSLV